MSKTIACNLIFLFFIANAVILHAQHQDVGEKPQTWKSANAKSAGDSTHLISAFKNGSISGHFRSFFMATDNRNQLSDYHALAMGGGLKYETAFFHHWRFGLSGFYMFDIFSSDLTASDSTTNQTNRYEIGLYDITEPEKRKELSRLEEFYLRYQVQKFEVTIGKQLLNTPFINLQDGRMRPTISEGLWIEVKSSKRAIIEGGYLYAISPRSTESMYSISESIGIYPSGVNVDGKPSAYKGNIESAGIYNLGITYNASKQLKAQLWQLYADNLFYSGLAQLDYKWPVDKQWSLNFGIQGIYQHSAGAGGNPDPQKTYFPKGSSSFVYGTKVGVAKSNVQTYLAYTRITERGRYLMPREWGRDPFYTFMPRERNEGLGDVHAAVWNVACQWPAHRIKTSLTLGYFDLPDVKNTLLNKYGMPSYWQFNADFRYSFAAVLNGLEGQILYLYKLRTGPDYGQGKYAFNKVDMSNLNVVLNFRF
ncbi:MAG: outer membrane porin, OprD family [Saprospiraceae bacterium]|nr:outer membrane porin, OprD family [Saprospiraceae bacterium]